MERAAFGHVLREKADLQVPLRGRTTRALVKKSEESQQGLLLEGCIKDGHTETKVQLALRLAFASTNIQCRCKQSHVKNRTDSDMNICVLLVGFIIALFSL